MHGRRGQDDDNWDSWNTSATGSHRFSGETGEHQMDEQVRQRIADATGKHRAIPKRPPGLKRFDQPPPNRRVSRPPYRPGRPRRSKRRVLVWIIGLLVGGLVVGIIAYGVTNFFLALGVSSGPANTASDFLSNLQLADYEQAYNDLDGTVTAQLSKNDFMNQAQADDHCYGQITGYSELAGSATSSADGNFQSFTYMITRNKLSKPYQMRLNLQKSAAGDWSITGYGGDLGPAPPTCK